MYIVLGTALDGISMIVLTTAIVIPMIKQAGFDLVWFGIFVVLVVEMAEVSPPVGFNLFVLQTMSGKDSNTVARASLPFFFLLVLAVAIITVFPDIVHGAAKDGFPEPDLQREGWPVMTSPVRHLRRARSGRGRSLRRLRRRRRPSGICPPPIRPTIRTPRISRPSPRTSPTAPAASCTITVHAGASLFKAPEIKRAVPTGQAQMGEVLISIHENEDPIFGIDVVPFLATSFDDAKKLWKASQAGDRAEARRQGMMVLFAVPWAPQGIYAKKDINTIEDMKGLKWRAYNVGTARIGELVGAQAVTIQAAELPQALATGVVNAFMSSGATGYDSQGLGDADPFLRHAGLDPEERDLRQQGGVRRARQADPGGVLKAAAAAEERGWKIWQEKTKWYLDQLAAKGMKVLPPSAALAAGFKKIGEQLTADWLKKAGADGQAVVDAYRKM